jgi:hypothetical protein
MIYIIKNYYKDKDVVLTTKSIRYFDPTAHIILFDYTKERNTFLSPKLGNEVFYNNSEYPHAVNKIAKYDLGPGYGSPVNGFYYSEFFNDVMGMFSYLDEKVILLDENHFFTNGNTIKELKENDWDLAYGTWWGPNSNDNLDVNASVIGINPSKSKHLFPLPEMEQYIEFLLKDNLLKPCIKDNLNVYQMKNRTYNSQGCNYHGDGIWTNSAEEMEKLMKENEII